MAGEVVVLSAGPERVGSTLREALAKGADRAIHIVTRRTVWAERDTLGVARLLAEAVRRRVAGYGADGIAIG